MFLYINFVFKLLVCLIDDNTCSKDLKQMSKKRQALSSYNLPNKVSLLCEKNSMFVSKIFSNPVPLNNKNTNESDSVSFHESSLYSSFESSILSEMDSTVEKTKISPLSLEGKSNHLMYTSNLWCQKQLKNSQQQEIKNMNMPAVVNHIPQNIVSTPVSDTQDVNK